MKNFCTGALAGTIGFFGSRVSTTLPLAAKIAVSAGASALAAYAIRTQPTLRHEEHVRPIELIAGAIVFNAMGYTIDAMQAPAYVNLPFLLACNAILNTLVDYALRASEAVDEVAVDPEISELKTIPSRPIISNQITFNYFEEDYDDVDLNDRDLRHFANDKHKHKFTVAQKFQI